MSVLIAYGTSEGQTRKIANFVASRIRELGHEAVTHDTADYLGELRLEDFDRMIVAGSVHERGHQEGLELFVLSYRQILEARPTMFLSVSLSAAFEDGCGEANGYVEKFLDSTGWKPTRRLLVAGALRHGEYGYYKKMIVKHQVLKDHALTNPETDQEFTDWNALEKAVVDFVAE